jgi:hypothetical protein
MLEKVKICPGCGEMNSTWREHCSKCQTILIDEPITFKDLPSTESSTLNGEGLGRNTSISAVGELDHSTCESGGSKDIDAAISEDPRFKRIVPKLVSQSEFTFSEGQTEVLAIPESDPVRLCAIREAIRIRNGKREVSFYEPIIGDPVVQGRNEIPDARKQILQLAKSKSLLDDPRTSGNLLYAFLTLHGFQEVVDLLIDVKEVGGLSQWHAYQLLYNQNRSSVMLRKSQKGVLWRCPKCRTTLEKREGAAALVIKAGGELVGMVTCGQCGEKYSLQDIYTGKYDI